MKFKGVIMGAILIGLLSISFLFLWSKHHPIKEPQIITKTQESSRYIIGLHYPKTNISELDKLISHYIDQQVEYFTSHYGDSDYLIDRDELNIDYRYYADNHSFISISFTSYINSYKLQHPINEVKTLFYDIKKKKILSLTDLLNIEEQRKLLTEVTKRFQSEYHNYIIKSSIDSIVSINTLKQQEFFIDQSFLYLYFSPDVLASDYYDIVVIKLPISSIHFSLNFSSSSQKTSSDIIEQVTKVIDPTQKVVALTFDDGPSEYTKKIIQILKKYDVCATFFVLGNKVEFYQDVLIQSLNNGNELGNHSYNHKWLSRLSVSEFQKQIETTQKIIEEKLHYHPTFLRPTYGSVTNRIRNHTDLKIALWTVDTRDWKIKNVDRIVERATTDIEDGDIILMHDIFERSAEAIQQIIPILKEQGFQLVTLSELEEVKLLRTKVDGAFSKVVS